MLVNLHLDAQSEAYENLVKAGVIDPTKVVRTAPQNAGSIASLLLTTEALVSEIQEEKQDARQVVVRRVKQAVINRP